MSAPGQSLPHVLARIDADLDDSIARLFKLLEIESISTDPAHADDCRIAATSIAADLSTLDMAAEVHPTDGHPIVFAKASFADGP
jgi:acetylornithine deacetylase/succinyl-diaminopimelate desuccinylase-like protein